MENYLVTNVKKMIGIGREVEGRRKDGSTFPLDLSVSEVNAHGERMFSGIVRDITERKEAEAILKQTLEDLQISNAELEKFAYVASHDLKSPLRAIDNLTKWLEEDLDDVLNDRNRAHMEKLRGRVLRMENLLDDLLEYSRAGRNLDNSEIIKSERLVREISDFLDVPKGFVVKADESLKGINVPRMPLEQIFHNLVGNALKHHDKEKGTITVSAKNRGEFYEFSVADDGPGIPKKYQEQVFEMFQTLKSRDEVEGSGMGLALVKKIVHNFGGQFRLESEEGQGSTFIFTWPKNPEIKSGIARENQKAA